MSPSLLSWFYSCTRGSPTNKTDHHDIAEILLKVSLKTITQPNLGLLWDQPLTYLRTILLKKHKINNIYIRYVKIIRYLLYCIVWNADAKIQVMIFECTIGYRFKSLFIITNTMLTANRVTYMVIAYAF